ncbi:hypothetical protein HI914_00194 [Erysiphe necator]|nr:hypothetical protein HI914_00194 [Erysiphe necator]
MTQLSFKSDQNYQSCAQFWEKFVFKNRIRSKKYSKHNSLTGDKYHKEITKDHLNYDHKCLSFLPKIEFLMKIYLPRKTRVSNSKETSTFFVELNFWNEPVWHRSFLGKLLLQTTENHLIS